MFFISSFVFRWILIIIEILGFVVILNLIVVFLLFFGFFRILLVVVSG